MTFEFQRNEDGSLSVHEAVFQALGAASMCWPPPGAQVFDSEKAKEIGDTLLDFLFVEGARSGRTRADG